MLSLPLLNPVTSYAQALERVQALKARDDARIRPDAYTILHDHGERTPLAVLLLHGLTNHPGQFATFAPLVFAQGANVLVPRLPEQGDRDRMTDRLARLTAEQLVAASSEAFDIACGLGERVCVLGISSSALLCALFAQLRADVARAIPVNPVFAILRMSYPGSRALASVMRNVVPNFFMWWDPRNKLAQRPLNAYPRFPTRALAQSMRLADDVYERARREPFKGKSIAVVTNKHDPAVNNGVTEAVVEAWRARRPNDVLTYEFEHLPGNHDIISTDNPLARTEIVYPKLLELVLGTP